ncbi:aspartic peptidase domain-containing protein [Mycena galopus ATCC 62051]|nr:aspartic peptidase domain-containing protein [Mycena galopus ATCC 62051]
MWSLSLCLLLAASIHRSCGLVVPSTPFSLSARGQPNVMTLEAISNLNLSHSLDPIDIRACPISFMRSTNSFPRNSGSSDLWIAPPKDFAFNNTGVSIFDEYVGGDVNGTLGVATVELGGYSFGSQAFNNATVVSVSGTTDIGLDGLMGLSFESPDVSSIMATFSALGQNPNLGKPFLYNIFDQTPAKNNFIGVSLPRTDDPNGSATGSFSINAVDPAYAPAANAPSLPLFPANGLMWSILLDSISVDNVTVPLLPSNVAGTPAGKVVALLDTGTPTALFRQQQLDAIYSKIPGAVNATIRPGKTVWTIPCNTTASLALHFGGQAFPIHPLDISSVVLNSNNTPVCATPWDASDEAAPFDIILGDSFMRNFYTIFNFGDTSQTPTVNSSIQLLSQTDAAAAAKDAVQLRTALLANFSASAQHQKTVPLKGSGMRPSAPVLVGLLFAAFINVVVQSL